MTEKLTGTPGYFSYLVEHAEKLLAAGDYRQVSYDVLSCGNNFRSGWTDEIDELFHNPHTPEEVRLVERMATVIEATVRGLLETAKAGAGFSEFVLLEHIAIQLSRLGVKAPREMVASTRTLIEQSQALGAPEFMSISLPVLELLSRLDKSVEEMPD